MLAVSLVSLVHSFRDMRVGKLCANCQFYRHQF